MGGHIRINLLNSLEFQFLLHNCFYTLNCIFFFLNSKIGLGKFYIIFILSV